MRKLWISVFYCVLILSLAAMPVEAAAGAGSGKPVWQTDGIPVRVTPGLQGAPKMVSDGQDGAILAWSDQPDGEDQLDIYAQHLNPEGTTLWGTEAKLIYGDEQDQSGPRILSDGAGGAFIGWSDHRNGNDYDVYIQHIDAAGNLLWDETGILAAGGTANQILSEIVSDGNGGIFVVFTVWADPPSEDITIAVQRINSSGVVLWKYASIVSEVAGYKRGVMADQDGLGYVIVAWGDSRKPEQENLYAQRISPDGVIQWLEGGRRVTATDSVQRPGVMMGDGFGGIYIAWYDFRNMKAFSDVYLQHIASCGCRLTEDVALFTDPNKAEAPDSIVPAPNYGAMIIASVEDGGDPSTADVVARRIDPDGSFIWGDTIPALANWSGQQAFSKAVTDHQGGAYVVWMDGTNPDSGYDIGSQHLNADGTLEWKAGGTVVTNAPNMQDSLAIVPSGQGFITAWQDYRNNIDIPDLYAQRVIEPVVQIFLPVVFR